MLVPPWLVMLSVVLFGLAFGSFANVVIWRLPRGESLSTPASHCPACDTSIAWYDNVPLVGWLVLRARCRSCGTRISARYPAVELLSALLWLAALMEFGFSVRFVFAAALFYLLMILSFIDFDTMRLPNVLVAFVGLIGLSGVAVQWVFGTDAVPLIDGMGRITHPAVFAALGVVLGGLVPWAISGAYRLLRGVHGIGMGDIKLLAVGGLYVGPYVVLALFIGAVVGSIASIVIGRGEGARRVIPFGPFLAIGIAVTALVGPGMFGWYLSLM